MPPLLPSAPPLPEYDQPGSVFVYVASISASHASAATTNSHHDSRTSRANRGERSTRAAVLWRAGRFVLSESLCFENISLQRLLRAKHYHSKIGDGAANVMRLRPRACT